MLVETIDYRKGRIRIIDQTALPERLEFLTLETVEQMEEAIRSLRVRGAPAIGIAGAFGILLAIDDEIRKRSKDRGVYIFDSKEGFKAGALKEVTLEELASLVQSAAEGLVATRPTAVNLSWALKKMVSAFRKPFSDSEKACSYLAGTAFGIRDSELETEMEIGKNGCRYIEDGMRVLTHCNAGGLATAGYGTALAVIYRAAEEGKSVTVYADETRPLLQGSRLTSWELKRNAIDVRVLCDNAAASLFSTGLVDCVVVGADRIALNGDTANKIGTLGLAVLCRNYDIPFYVAAPLSTFDPSIESGDRIPIEERPPDEVAFMAGRRLVPEGVGIYNPAFDVTPAEYISSIITEKGVIEEPGRKKILEIL